jgi:hypothetical protein
MARRGHGPEASPPNYWSHSMRRFFVTRWPGRILVLGLALGLTSAAAAAPPEKLFPDNTTMLFSVNLKGLVDSPLYQKALKGRLEELMKGNERFTGIMRSMSFDPMKDLSSFTVAIGNFNVDLAGGPPRPDVEAVIILKGNFDIQKVETALEALISAGGRDRVSVSKLGTRTLFEIKQDGDRSMFGVFIDKETVALCDSKDNLQIVIDKAEGKKTTKLTKEFETALAKADTRRTVWGAMIMPESIKQLASMAPQGAVMEKIESMNFSVNVKENLEIELNAYAADNDSAAEFKKLLDQAKELMGIAALQAPDEQDSKDISDFISSLRISNNQKLVSMKGELKGSMIERAVKKAGGDGQ